MLKYINFNSLIGEICVVWDANTHLLKQVVLPELTTHRQNSGKIIYSGVIAETDPDDFVYDLMSDIKDIVLGKKINFSTDRIDFSDLTDFQKTVLIKQAEIPHAHVTTYKHLAELAGKPKSARPTANVLANNRFPLVIPCHRTVKSDWTLGGYAGSTENSFKRFILENEGITLQEDDVISREFRYPSIKDSLIM